MAGRGRTAYRRPVPLAQLSLVLSIAIVGVVAITTVTSQQTPVHVLVAGLAMMVALVVGATSPRRLLLLMVIWLIALGALRRLLFLAEPDVPYDAVLLVGPFAVGVLLIAAVRKGALKSRTPLANGVLALSALALLGALNPLQGSLLVGLAGLLFFFVPQLGFWIGRRIADDQTMMSIAKLIAVAAPVVALYGLSQTFLGFLPWDQAWIDSARAYAAVGVAGTTRAFSSFSASSDYASFLAIGIVVWLALGFRRFGSLIAVPVLGLLGAALLFESGRGIIVLLLVAIFFMGASRLKFPLPVAGLGAVLVVVLIPLVASKVDATTLVQGPAVGLVSHVTEGLSDPFGASSTLLLHLNGFTQGLALTITHPFGLGVGAVTLGTQKFGGVSSGTEADISDAAVALGFPGLLAYLVVLVLGIRNVYKTACRRRDSAALIALGIPLVLLMRWLAGGQYAVAVLPWLVLGWADWSTRSTRSADIQEIPFEESEALQLAQGSRL
jgi:hypothetical protein